MISKLTNSMYIYKYYVQNFIILPNSVFLLTTTNILPVSLNFTLFSTNRECFPSFFYLWKYPFRSFQPWGLTLGLPLRLIHDVYSKGATPTQQTNFLELLKEINPFIASRHTLQWFYLYRNTHKQLLLSRSARLMIPSNFCSIS